MFEIGNKSFLFAILSSSALMSGFGLKLDEYEHNSLINLNNGYAKVIMSKKAFDYLKLKKNNLFTYFLDKEKYRQKISNVEHKNNQEVEIVLATSISKSIYPISYKSGVSYIWREIFK